jgi:hypothetical protein
VGLSDSRFCSEATQVKLLVEQVVQCMFESTRHKLPLQVNSQKSGAAINVFVTRHLLLQNIVLKLDLDIYFGSRHDAGMNRLFLQPRQASCYNSHHL